MFYNLFSRTNVEIESKQEPIETISSESKPNALALGAYTLYESSYQAKQIASVAEVLKPLDKLILNYTAAMEAGLSIWCDRSKNIGSLPILNELETSCIQQIQTACGELNHEITNILTIPNANYSALDLFSSQCLPVSKKLQDQFEILLSDFNQENFKASAYGQLELVTVNIQIFEHIRQRLNLLPEQLNAIANQLDRKHLSQQTQLLCNKINLVMQTIGAYTSEMNTIYNEAFNNTTSLTRPVFGARF